MDKVSYKSKGNDVHFGNTIQNNIKTDSRARFTCYLFTVAMLGTLGGFSFGYDTGVISGELLFIKTEFELNSFDQEILVSVTIATAMLTALASGYLGDRIGRRPCMLIGSFIFTIGAVINGFSQTSLMLIIGRGILGLGIGFLLMISPVYIAECSPVEYRGPLVTLCTVMMVWGRCVACVVDGAFSYDRTAWRYMVGVTGIPSSIQFIAFLFLPETPRWLVRNGKEEMAATILQKVRGREEVSDDIKQIKDICQEEIKLTELQGNELMIKKVMTTPSVRRALIVGVSTSLFQQLSGINTVMYYSGTIIQMSGIRDESLAIWLTAVTAFVSSLFTMTGVYLVERIGRRKLILGSMAGEVYNDEQLLTYYKLLKICLQEEIEDIKGAISVFISLVVLAVGFQLSDINSPTVTIDESLSMNDTCSSYSTCGNCIEDQNCGYCYIEDGYSAVNGSCISKVDNHGITGRCNSTALPSGVVWGVMSCPSTYFWICLLGLTLYLVTFSPGIGPLPMTINSEIYPLWARSTCMAIASSTNWLFSLVMSLSFLSLMETVTAYGAYWIFSGVVVVGMIFLFFTLPETKDKQLEEVETLFETPWCVCGKSGSFEINLSSIKQT